MNTSFSLHTRWLVNRYHLRPIAFHKFCRLLDSSEGQGFILRSGADQKPLASDDDPVVWEDLISALTNNCLIFTSTTATTELERYIFRSFCRVLDPPIQFPLGMNCLFLYSCYILVAGVGRWNAAIVDRGLPLARLGMTHHRMSLQFSPL